MVPESNRFNALLREIFFASFVTLDAFKQTVLNTIKLHRQFCVGTIKVQNTIANGVLSAEFETGKSAPAQRPPKLRFLFGLIAAKMAGDLFEAHFGMMMVLRINSSPSP